MVDRFSFSLFGRLMLSSSMIRLHTEHFARSNYVSFFSKEKQAKKNPPERKIVNFFIVVYVKTSSLSRFSFPNSKLLPFKI